MGYEIAKNKAWEELCKLKPDNKLAVKFLQDEFEVDPKNRTITSLSCNVPAKDFYAVLILHYLLKKTLGLPKVAGEWLTFRELSGVEGYSDAFKKRVIEPIIRKYGNRPQDSAFTLDAFEGVPVLIKVWKPDEEFGPDANIYFDKSIKDIFCTEDIVVLAGIVAGQL